MASVIVNLKDISPQSYKYNIINDNTIIHIERLNSGLHYYILQIN